MNQIGTRNFESSGQSARLRPPSSQPVVTQAELARLVELRNQKNEFEALRKSILERLDAGASQEPGRYGVEVSQQEHRRFSRSALEAAIGKADTDEFYSNLAPTTIRRLTVHSFWDGTLEDVPSTASDQEISTRSSAMRERPTNGGTTSPSSSTRQYPRAPSFGSYADRRTAALYDIDPLV